jgi:SnoaL-like domain
MTSLQEMQNIKECENVILEIAWLTDHGPHLQIVDHFTIDGSFSRDGEIHVGKAALEDMYKKRPASLFTRHILSNIRVKMLSDTEAVATSYAMVFRFRSAEGGAPVPPVDLTKPESLSEYHDTFQNEGGAWKISSRLLKTMINVV